MTPVCTLGFVSDLHFGPEARHRGKLRKLSKDAPQLLEGALREMLARAKPDLLVNLGDDIEDESPGADLARYTDCQRILRSAGLPLLNVAGNHDSVHLSRGALRDIWQEEGVGTLDRVVDVPAEGDRRLRVIRLESQEEKDRVISLSREQLGWLEVQLTESAWPVVIVVHHSLADQDLTQNPWFEGRPHIALIRERHRVQEMLAGSGKVLAVINGHVHWNHVWMNRGIPYVTVQSLIENLDDDAPGRPAAAFMIARIFESKLRFEFEGAERFRFECSWPSAATTWAR